MSGREGNLVSWCDNGFKVGLKEHLVSVAETLMSVERLWSPVRAADKALAGLVGRAGLVASAAMVAALLHDLGKSHEGFVRACAERGSTTFPYHEAVGAYLLFKVGESGSMGRVHRLTAYLASYAVLAHHHAMEGRGLGIIHGGGNDHEFMIPPAAADVVRGALEDVSPFIVSPADEGLVKVLVNEVASMVGDGGIRIRLRDVARDMRISRVPRPRSHTISPARVKAALFSNLPSASYLGGNVIRRAGFTLAGVLAAADTLAASVERGSCSVFCLRLVRELVG